MDVSNTNVIGVLIKHSGMAGNRKEEEVQREYEEEIGKETSLSDTFNKFLAKLRKDLRYQLEEELGARVLFSLGERNNIFAY